MNIKSLYEHASDAGLEPIPELSRLSDIAAGHTMGEKLVDYVKTKFPEEQRRALALAREHGWRIRVIGAYSGHEALWMDVLNESYPADAATQRFLQRPAASSHKRFNKRRPHMLITQQRGSSTPILNIVSFPSREYTQQVAGLVHAAFKYDLLDQPAPGGSGSPNVEVLVFPQLETRVGEWTGLRESLRRIPPEVLARGIVLFGYIEEVAALLKSRSGDFSSLVLPGCNDSAVDRIFEIEAFAYRKDKFYLLTFGFHHTYWGSASAKLLEEFLAGGVKHAIYFAKLGARIFLGPDPGKPFDTSAGITGGLTAPGGPYYSLRYEAESQKYRLSPAIAPRKLIPPYHYAAAGGAIAQTAVHISVPSVVGETRKQEQVYSQINPATVDNEISFMADAVLRSHPAATFDCVHFVTDFVTAAYSKHWDTEGGLDQDNRNKKREQLRIAAGFLVDVIETIKRDASELHAPAVAAVDAETKPAATRDYLSIHGEPPADYPRWMRPTREYARLASLPSARQVFLAAARSMQSRNEIHDLLQDALSSSSRNIDIGGHPGGGKSLTVNALYYELLHRFRTRHTALRPLLLELKRLERHAIEWSDAELRSGSKPDQRKFLEAELANADRIVMAEMAVGPTVIIVNGVDTSSPLYALLEPRLNSWRKYALRCGSRVVAVWRKSEWIMGSIQAPQDHPDEYRMDLDVAELVRADDDTLLRALCEVYACTRERFVQAFELACASTGERSPTLRIVVHFMQGKAQTSYFPDVARNYLGSNGHSGAEHLDAAEIAYSIVVERIPSRNALLSRPRRLVSGSDEITAYFAARLIHQRILDFAQAGRRIGSDELRRMDRVFSHRINYQLKRIVNESAATEYAAATSIQSVWRKLAKSPAAKGFMHFKSVLMYLCGRFTTEPARRIGVTVLKEALRDLPGTDVSGGNLSLHRTVHISLMILGEDGAEYFRYLRRTPHFDAINRGFHLTYYHDQDYWSDPCMESADRGGPFRNTYLQLQQMMQGSNAREAVHAITAYTVISLCVNRFKKGRLEETLPLSAATALLRMLESKSDMPLVVRHYARWAAHYLETGVSVVLQAIIGLKREARAGWNHQPKGRVTPAAESVADHSLGAILLARAFLPDAVTDLDGTDQRLGSYSKAAVISMLEVHDLAEGLLGDKVAPSRDSQDDEDELGAMIGISALAAAEGVPVPMYCCSEMEDRLAEFQAGETLNARLAADFDRMESLVQLMVYGADPKVSIPDAAEFERDVRAKLTTRTAQRICDGILREIKGKDLAVLCGGSIGSADRGKSKDR